jgi:2-methylcitrate dehydratase
LLIEKFQRNLARRFDTAQQQTIMAACSVQAKLEAMRVDEFVSMFVVKE